MFCRWSVGLICLCGVLFQLHSGEEVPEQTSVRQFSLGGLNYESVRNLLTKDLSENAEISYDPVADRVTLRDKTAHLIKAQQSYVNYLQSQPNVRITLTAKSSSEKKTNKIAFVPNKQAPSSSGRRRTTRTGVEYAPRSTGTVGVGSAGGMDVGVKNVGVSSNTTTFLTVQSGLSARLWVGESTVNLVPLEKCFTTDEWIIVTQNAVIVKGPQMVPVWQDAGVSLMIRPEVMPNGSVRVSLFPEISYPTKEGVAGRLRVMSLESTVILTPNEELDLGGVIQKNKERYLSLFGPTFLKQKEIQTVTNMTVKASVLKRKNKK